MNPLFFSSSERPLFGAYHAPANKPARNRGVVVCNPFGDEAIKAHRALAQLAAMLAAERYHVLRFDYFGTGDSAGEGSEATAAQWIEDIGDAIDELRDTSGVAKVSLVGLRFGGTLALQAAAGRRDIDKVLLWEPVVRGKQYVADLLRFNREYLEEEFGGLELDPARLAPSTGDEVMGFPLPPTLRQEMERVDLSTLELARIRRVAIVTSTRSPDVVALQSHLEGLGAKVALNHVPVGVNWNSDAAMESSLVPIEALRAIVEEAS